MLIIVFFKITVIQNTVKLWHNYMVSLFFAHFSIHYLYNKQASFNNFSQKYTRKVISSIHFLKLNGVEGYPKVTHVPKLHALNHKLNKMTDSV